MEILAMTHVQLVGAHSTWEVADHQSLQLALSLCFILYHCLRLIAACVLCLCVPPSPLP